MAASKLFLAQGAPEGHAAVVYHTRKIGEEGRGGIFQLQLDAVEADKRNLPGAVQVLDGFKAVEGKLDFRLEYLVRGDLVVRANAPKVQKY